MELTLPIREVALATPRTRLLRLDLDAQPFEYLAGQVVVVGRPGQPVRRPYSLASAPHETRLHGGIDLLVSVKETGEPGAHLGTLRPGVPLVLGGPIGSFVLPATIVEPHLLFVAGGTGIAPVRALLMEALRREASHVPQVLYSARDQDDFAFGDELRALAARGRIGLHQTITRGESRAPWPGTVGRIDRARLSAVLRDTSTLCFVSGPHALVQEVPRALEELGVLPHRIRVEEWTA